MQQSMKNVNAASKWNLFLCTLVGWLLLVPLGVYLRQSAAATADDDKDDPISLQESGNETTRLEKVFIRLTDGLSARDDDQWCQRMADGKMEAAERTRLKQWTFKSEKKLLAALWAEKETGKKATGFANAGCLRLRNLFPFQDEPLSKEERQYPLAYGLLVHKSPIQVLAMISAIYQPQNAYCVAIDEKAEPQFKQAMLLLADCFPNIFVMSTVGPVQWCKFGITRAVFNCLRHLSQMKHDWRYYQYLSGVDLPLKTNLEMVRIFKALNGSVNMEVTQFDRGRRHDGTLEAKPPLPLWKSSLSALISRPAANAMVGSEKVQQLLRFLQSTDCSDESLWATAAGNPKDLSVPGGFSAADFYATINKCKKARAGKTVVVQNGKQQRHGNGTMLAPTFYYISRYQVWEAGEKCKGKLVKGSCAFGVDDLPVLIRRPELIAHKMHLDYQPAAYFCLWKIVQERTLDERRQKEFKADSYSHLWPTMLKASNGGNEKDPNSDMCRLLVH